MPRDSSKTRKKILEASIDLLNKGYSPDIGMSDFASHADVSRQTLYVQFSSRGKLLAQTFRYLNDEQDFTGKFAFFDEEPSDKDLVATTVKLWDEHYQNVNRVAKALLATMELEPDIQAVWNEWMEHFRQLCARFVQSLKSADLLDGRWSPGTSTDLIMGILSLDNWSFLRLDCGWSERQYQDHISTMLKRTFVD